MSQEIERSERGMDLILTLSLDEEIIQFNKESEQLTGYSRNEILHKKFDEVLVPVESIKQWKDLLGSIRQSLWIDNFTLPLKTKDNQIHMISWTGFLVKDENGVVKDICIFGKPIKSEFTQADPSESSTQAPSAAQPEPVRVPQIESEVSSAVSDQSYSESSEDASSPTHTHSDEAVITPEFQSFNTQDESFQSAEKSKNERATFPKISPDKNENSYQFSQVELQKNDQKTPEQRNTEIIMKHRVKKILFARKKRDEESTISPTNEHLITPLTTLETLLEATSQKIDLMNETLRNLSQNYETIADRVTELEKNERRWGKKHQKDEKNLHFDIACEEDVQSSEQQESDLNNPDLESEQQHNTKEFTFFSDPFGFKRQHVELDQKRQQLEIRSKAIAALEIQLQKEQNIFNARVEEFSKWREKLQLLESAIENRRQELMRQENVIFDQTAVSSTPSLKNPLKEEPLKDAEITTMNSANETVDSIPQSAAILQRGILKQVNTPFIELLGLPREEIVEKSFFDFIALEGLAEVEKYYLDRLKGEDVSLYKTVFSTKNNTKIPVEVSIKQTIYNGEKAEIVIITTSTT